MVEKHYECYKGRSMDETLEICRTPGHKKDRLYVDRFIKDVIMLLKNQSITIIPNFAQIFRDAELKRDSVIDFAMQFADYYNDNHQDHIEWLKVRTFRNCNQFERDLAITRLFFEYPVDIEYFLNHIYINQKQQKQLDLQQKLFIAIKQIKDQVKNYQPQVQETVVIHKEDFFHHDEMSPFESFGAQEDDPYFDYQYCFL